MLASRPRRAAHRRGINPSLTARAGGGLLTLQPTPNTIAAMREDYLKEAHKIIPEANVLINVVSRRVKQLKRGSRALVESLEKLSPEDIALREIIEGKISHEIAIAK
jgi:DNA-directed RNA polymerase subunit omega